MKGGVSGASRQTFRSDDKQKQHHLAGRVPEPLGALYGEWWEAHGPNLEPKTRKLYGSRTR
jgi:hypothetical protein